MQTLSSLHQRFLAQPLQKRLGLVLLVYYSVLISLLITLIALSIAGYDTWWLPFGPLFGLPIAALCLIDVFRRGNNLNSRIRTACCVIFGCIIATPHGISTFDHAPLWLALPVGGGLPMLFALTNFVNLWQSSKEQRAVETRKAMTVEQLLGK